MARKKRPTGGAPGDSELQEMCDHATLVKELCDLLGFEFRGHRHLSAQLRGARHAGMTSVTELMDLRPEDRPYIWDEEE